MIPHTAQRTTRTAMKGFTLIELIVVVSLTVLLMLTATSIFLSTLVGNTKNSASLQVRNEGEYALSQMEFLLRNAVELVPNSDGLICEQDMSSIAFKSYDSGITELLQEEDVNDSNMVKIASNSGVKATVGSSSTYLTSGSIQIVSDLDFDCQRGADLGTAYVTISFDLQKGETGVDKDRDIVRQTFQTGVNLRSI